MNEMMSNNYYTEMDFLQMASLVSDKLLRPVNTSIIRLTCCEVSHMHISPADKLLFFYRIVSAVVIVAPILHFGASAFYCLFLFFS